MKMIRTAGTMLALASALTFASCGSEKNDTEGSAGSGSASETTPNDSSGAESRAAMGVADDNQKDTLGYPSNQSNLNSDSTSKLHDDTTKTRKKPR